MLGLFFSFNHKYVRSTVHASVIVKDIGNYTITIIIVCIVFLFFIFYFLFFICEVNRACIYVIEVLYEMMKS